ncbi:holo-ACP synthase [Priestia megaterium]|nr:holo-ACP synthase [Priestia megaterium]
MIIGIGIDITELDRIEKLIERQPSFINRILTKNEKKRYEELSGKRKVEFVAGRFSTKEAYSKALGTGIGENFSFQDIEVINDKRGKPTIAGLNHTANYTIHVSITHSDHYAVAQVILESSSS